jgi:hypothetical protein
MAMEDWAIVVGITAYPGLSELGGPETGAREFFDWVTSPKPEGGGIHSDSGRARLIISSECEPAPPYSDFSIAEPTVVRISRVFEQLYVLSEQNRNNDKGSQVGGRLYLYFAGHGFDPQGQVALFMANTAEGIFGNHISGTGWAEWFYKAGFFEEIVLFMDCCRDYIPGIPANPVTFKEQIGGNQLKKKRFYCYATDWGKKSWERKMNDGKIRGVFTETLMQGLLGAACDRSTGEITTNSLRGYLKDAMPFFFDEQDRKNSSIRKDPTLPDFGDGDFIVAQVQVTNIPSYQITIQLPAEFLNQELQLIYGSGAQMKIMDLNAPLGTSLPLTLSRGSYTLRVKGPGGVARGFDVTGIGSEDVIPK